MAEIEGTDLYRLLQAIQERPLMYIRDGSLEGLEDACHWYATALGVHDIEEFGSRFYRRFREYLSQRFGWSMACGWARAIREHSRSAEEAFTRFYQLLEEFKECEE